MTFELYRRRSFTSLEPTISLTKSGLLVLNVAAAKILLEKGAERVELLFDREARKIAVRIADKRNYELAFRVNYQKERSSAAVISSGGFLNFVGHDRKTTKRYAAKWHEDTLTLEADLERS